MFIGLRRKLVSKTLEAIKKRTAQQRIKSFTAPDNVHSLAVLSVLQDGFSIEELNSFVEEYVAKGIDVDVIVVNQEKSAVFEIPENGNYYIVGKSDFRWSGVLKNKSVSDVLLKRHDYLIDLTRANAGIVACLAAQSMAKFKVGLEMFSDSVYDFAICVDPSCKLAELRSQMSHYLRKIC